MEGMTTGNLSEYHYKVVELKQKNDKMVIAIKGAIAALSQNKTFQADIDAAKAFLNDSLT